jgi:hypothetical protein
MIRSGSEGSGNANALGAHSGVTVVCVSDHGRDQDKKGG